MMWKYFAYYLPNGESFASLSKSTGSSVLSWTTLTQYSTQARILMMKLNNRIRRLDLVFSRKYCCRWLLTPVSEPYCIRALEIGRLKQFKRKFLVCKVSFDFVKAFKVKFYTCQQPLK